MEQTYSISRYHEQVTNQNHVAGKNNKTQDGVARELQENKLLAFIFILQY